LINLPLHKRNILNCEDFQLFLTSSFEMALLHSSNTTHFL
jgi:hypothetical protein